MDRSVFIMIEKVLRDLYARGIENGVIDRIRWVKVVSVISKDVRIVASIWRKDIALEEGRCLSMQIPT